MRRKIYPLREYLTLVYYIDYCAARYTPINDAADNEVKRYDTNSHVFPLELPPSRLATSGDPTGTAMYV